MNIAYALIIIFSDGIHVQTNEIFSNKKECETRVKELNNKSYCLKIAIKKS
jgi:hypothetical protein